MPLPHHHLPAQWYHIEGGGLAIMGGGDIGGSDYSGTPDAQLCMSAENPQCGSPSAYWLLSRNLN